MDGYDVMAVSTQGPQCIVCSPLKLFDVRRLGINVAPRGIAYVESAGLFALNDPTQPTTLFFVDEHGHPKGTRTIQYLGGFSPGWLEGLAYIPKSSPLFPGDLIQVAIAFKPGESRLEVIQSDGQVAAEIIPAEPLHSSYITGVSFRAPDQILVGLDDNTMWALDFDGNILAGPIALDGAEDLEGIDQLSNGDIVVSTYDAGKLFFFDQNLNRLPNKDRDYKIGLGVSGPRGVAWNTDTNQHLVAHLAGLPQTSEVVTIPPTLDNSTQVVDLATSGFSNTSTMSYLPSDHVIALASQNPSTILLFDNSGNMVDGIGVPFGTLVALAYIPSTNQYVTAFPESPQLLLILDRRGNLVRVIDLSSAGIGAIEALTFFNPGDPTGGEFLLVVSDATNPYRQFLLITDFNGNSRGKVDVRKTFGLLEISDVSTITTGPQSGAFSIVDLLDSEIVVFRLQ
jgi:uncharacterized protein YjiK